MFVNKKHKYDINLWEIKRITGDQIPDSAFNSAVNYLFYRLEHIKSQIKSKFDNFFQVLKFYHIVKCF